jgi:hypothetical protein
MQTKPMAATLASGTSAGEGRATIVQGAGTKASVLAAREGISSGVGSLGGSFGRRIGGSDISGMQTKSMAATLASGASAGEGRATIIQGAGTKTGLLAWASGSAADRGVGRLGDSFGRRTGVRGIFMPRKPMAATLASGASADEGRATIVQGAGTKTSRLAASEGISTGVGALDSTSSLHTVGIGHEVAGYVGSECGTISSVDGELKSEIGVAVVYICR